VAGPRLIEILRILDARRVEFIVVGGMATVIGGAPIVTRDVDVLRKLGRPKDLLMALQIEATLAELRKKDSS
jgi:hypothetical protein